MIFVKSTILRKFIAIILSFNVVLFSCVLEANAFQDGETKLAVHKWGIEVYLSKDTVRCVGGGIGVTGVFVPEPIVTKAMAVTGFAVGCCPGGIVLEYHYAGLAAKLLCSNPIARTTLSYPTGFRWQ